MKRNLNINLDYKWEETDFNFPNTYPGHNYPAIYTWVLVSKKGEKSYYIGETQKLSRRVRFYMRPGPSQATNLRIKEAMDKSKEVHLYTLKINSLDLNGVSLGVDLLEDKYTRRGLEGLLIRELHIIKKGHKILNR